MQKVDLKMGRFLSKDPVRARSNGILVKPAQRGNFKRNDAFDALKPVVIWAQSITLMPLHGVFGNDFTQLSVKTALSLLLILSTSVLALVKTALLIDNGLNYASMGELLFYFGSSLLMIAFLRLAAEWNSVMRKWAEIDKLMLGFPRVDAGRSTAIFSFYMITTCLTEYILSLTVNFSSFGSLQKFFELKYKHIFRMTDFALWKGAVIAFVGFMTSMTWNFTNLFITGVSMSLRASFLQLNNELTSVRFKGMTVDYWRKIRHIYNKLSLLTKLLDEKLSFMILIAFGNNLYFITLQLLHSLNPIDTTIESIYFTISFGHLLIRTCTLCFAAASIHENSKAPLSTLFAVPSQYYNVEVQRLTTQISFDTIALTGCKFFSITRTLMLTVAGTIVTYEIVLVQFNALSDGANSNRGKC